MEFLFLALLVLVGVPLVAVGFGLAWILWKTVRGIGWLLKQGGLGVGALVRHIFVTLRNLLVDAFHCAGALITAALFLPLILVNLLLIRVRSAGYYARACEDEFLSALLGMYRVSISHPLRLVGLGVLLDGLERRLPEVIDREPGVPRVKPETFPGYKIKGSLAAGGSGANLFLARPLAETTQRWSEAGWDLPDRVVIKSFALQHGSTLPQIVRESRALEAAGRLGLVFDHELADDRFYYVMEYVDGDELGLAVQKLHARSGAKGLGEKELRRTLGWSCDLLGTLERFHTGGLWHKDVKPANLIVEGDRLQLVDFGLVTPLASCNTLTTHGTEYYRDPELVRQAMQGVKVHEVDGVKFDLYSAGAVLYSMLEDSFPAQGSLSGFSKSSPEALRWIVRRAMAEIDERYPSARTMLADLRHVAESRDPWAVLPAELPSSTGSVAETPDPAPARKRPLPAAVASTPSTATKATRRGDADTSGSRRRRRRRVAMAAGVIGLGMFGATGLIAGHLDGPRVHHRRPHVYAEAAARTHVPKLLPSERAAFELARDVVDAYEMSPESHEPVPTKIEVVVEPPPRVRHTKQRNGRTPRVESSLLPVEGPIVVLADVGAPIPRSALQSLEQSLQERGFRVLGAAGEELTESEQEAIASVHHAVGLASIHDDAAALVLQAHLAALPEVGAVLWVAAGEGQDRYAFRVLHATGVR